MRFEVELCGRIDAQNAPAVEKMLSEQIPVPGPDDEIVFDAKALDYISSSGLRVILKYRNKVRNCVINNVSPDIHEIFEMTGFTNMMEVNRALREVSINGLTLIGKGFNGEVYRLDDERIIKVYNPLSNSIDKIMREKEAVKQAFIHGIPSAISFDIVKVGERFGMIYELIDARTLGAAIEDDPSRLEAYAHRMAQLLKQLHSTVFEPGELPDARDNLKIWADIAEKSGFYSEEVISKLRHVIRSFKPTGTYIHGDFHPGNIMVSNDELVLIDMGDSSVGDPTIDLLGSYQIMKLVAQREGGAKMYSGMSGEHLARVWDIFIRDYTGIDDEDELMRYEEKLRFYSLIRSLPGITASPLVPKESIGKLTSDVAGAFLSGYETWEKERSGS